MANAGQSQLWILNFALWLKQPEDLYALGLAVSPLQNRLLVGLPDSSFFNHVAAVN